MQQAQTPGAGPGGAAAGAAAAATPHAPPSWLTDLDAYLHASSVPTEGRHELVAAVKASPASAEAWVALLSAEEAAGGGGLTSGLTGGLTGGGGVSLYHMYYWATQLVPRGGAHQSKEDYVRLWLGYARQQWSRSPDDARDTFKTLRNSAIGAASAHLYADWAGLEYAAGNVSRALGILAKGYKDGAQPVSLLDRLKAEMQSGTFDLKQQLFTETITVRLAGHHAPAPTPAVTPAATPAAGARAAAAGALATAASAELGSARRAGDAPLWAPSGATRGATAAAPPSAAPAASGGAPCGSVVSASHAAASVTMHSSSSRSTASGLNGDAHGRSMTVDRSSGSSAGRGVGAAEEDTISCGLAGRRGGGGGGGAPPGSHPPLLPGAAAAAAAQQQHPALAPSSQGQGAGSQGANTTATIGLKRFGFKSRALRVGGGAEPPPGGALAEDPATGTGDVGGPAPGAGAGPARLPPQEPHHHAPAAGGPAPPRPPVGPASAAQRAAAAPAAAGRAGSETEEGPQGRKRRAEDGGSAGGAVGSVSAAAGSGNAAAGPAPPPTRAAPPARAAAPAPAAAAPGAEALDSEDSLPLVMGKLAARLAPDKGTPVASHAHARRPPDSSQESTPEHGDGAGASDRELRARAAAGAGGSQGSTPLEGQLPSSLETTPLGAAAERAGGGSDGDADGCDAGAGEGAGAEVPSTMVLPSRTAALPTLLHASRHAAAAASASCAAPSGAADAPGAAPPRATAPSGPAAAPAAAAPRMQAPTQHARPEAAPSAAAAGAANAHPQQQRPAREPLRQVMQPVDPAAAASHSAAAAAAAKPKAPPAVSAHASLPQEQRPQAQQQQQQQQQQMAPPPPRQPQASQQQAPPQPAAPSGHAQQPLQQPLQQQQQQQQQQAQPQAPIQKRAREDAHTVYVQGVRYTKLECVGRGGSSKVFKVMGPNCKIFALKRIRLQGRDQEAAAGFIDEINLLNTLKGKQNIIQLIDAQVFTDEGLVYMVQEYGEIDLARLLAKHEAGRRQAPGAGGGGGGIDENFIRLYWQQMLQAVATVHELRIVHSDLKPANYLLVEGALKLIDFGIAKAIGGDTTSIARESQVGTLNYMSPEAILGGTNNILGSAPMKVGRPSDIWSLGCILYQMVYGRTPFADLPFIPKMHAICDPRHAIKYPPCSNPDVVDVMARCLDRDPKTRITMEELLDHPFLHPNRRRAPAPAAAPALAGLDPEQLRALVSQVARAGAAGTVDIEQLTQHVISQLGGGGGA